MLSNKPYLIRAFYEWINDSVCTPYILINANYPGCKVPVEFVEDGEIVFNVSQSAVRDLKIGNDFLEFKASFSGLIRLVSVPIPAVTAIYAEENGEGMYFDQGEERLLSAADWVEPALQDAGRVEEKSNAKATKVSYLKLVD